MDPGRRVLLSEAVSAAGHPSQGGKGGGCDIDIVVRVLQTGDSDAGVLERNDSVEIVKKRQLLVRVIATACWEEAVELEFHVL